MNEVEIQVLGMSRSGNHAVSNWIYAQAEGRKVLLNCAEGKTNPFDSCRPLASSKTWRAEPDFDIEAERRGRLTRKDLLVHTYEDSWLAHAFSAELDRRHNAWLGRSRRRHRLLILRDPFNLFASRLRMGSELSRQVARRMWKQHARVALGEGGWSRDGLRVVLYNRWAADPSYRRDLAAALGLRFTDEGASNVPDCAGGSSFDGTRFDGQAREMAVSERWRTFAADEEYWSIFDRELVRMAGHLFEPRAGEAAGPVGEGLLMARRRLEPGPAAALA